MIQLDSKIYKKVINIIRKKLSASWQGNISIFYRLYTKITKNEIKDINVVKKIMTKTSKKITKTF